MTSIKLIVTGASARAEVDGLLTSGMVGIPVTIVCDGAWDGLTKSMVCRAGSIVKTILNVRSTATVAHECMVPNQTLFIGIEGRNADGTLVIPTVWAPCGLIFSGATSDADPSADPTLPVWAQIDGKVGNLDELETTARDNLVAAINEVGALSSETLPDAINTALAQAKASGEFDGADGKSAYQYAQEGGYTGTEAEFAAKMAAEIPTVDSTLTQSSQAADAKATGDAISNLSKDKVNQADVDELKGDLDDVDTRLSESIDDISNAVDMSAISVKKNCYTSRNNPLVYVPYIGWASVIRECKEGDSFLIKGLGGLDAPLWMFTNDSGNILTESGSNIHYVRESVVIAPHGAKYISCNFKMSEGYFVAKGDKMPYDIFGTVESIDEKIGIVDSTKNEVNIVGKNKDGNFITTVTGRTLSYSAQTFFQNVTIDVTEGESYFIETTPSTGQKGRYVVLTDSNDVIISALIDNPDGLTTKLNGFVDIPRMVTRLHVFGYCSSSNYAEKIRVYKLRYETLQSQINNLRGKSIPDYWKSHIDDKCDELLNRQGTSLFQTVFFTDYHEADNTGYTSLIIDKIRQDTAIRDIVFGGDIINSFNDKRTAKAKIAKFYDDFRSLDMRYVIGNHEFNDPSSNKPENRLTDNDVKILIAKADGCKNNTYYIDDHVHHVRRYYLASMYNSSINADDIDFIAQSLLTIPKGYAVLVFSHITIDVAKQADGSYAFDRVSPRVAVVAGILNACKNKNASFRVYVGDYNYLIDYSGVECDVIGIIGGHSHIDYIAESNNIKVVVTTCDAWKQECGGLVRTVGAVTEQAFDVYSFDVDNRTTYITRIGAGEDRMFTF